MVEPLLFASLWYRVGTLDETLDVLGVPLHVRNRQPAHQRSLLVSPGEFEMLSALERVFPRNTISGAELYHAIYPNTPLPEEHASAYVAELASRFNSSFRGTPFSVMRDEEDRYKLDVTSPLLRLQMMYKNSREALHG